MQLEIHRADVAHHAMELPGALGARPPGPASAIDAGFRDLVYNNEQTKTWLRLGTCCGESRCSATTARVRTPRRARTAGPPSRTSFVKGAGESTFSRPSAMEIDGRNSDWMSQTPAKDPSFRFALASTNITENTYTGIRYRYETGGRGSARRARR